MKRERASVSRIILLQLMLKLFVHALATVDVRTMEMNTKPRVPLQIKMLGIALGHLFLWMTPIQIIVMGRLESSTRIIILQFATTPILH